MRHRYNLFPHEVITRFLAGNPPTLEDLQRIRDEHEAMFDVLLLLDERSDAAMSLCLQD